MTYPYVVFGDAEAACISILNTATEITSFSGGAPRVSSDFVGYEMGSRWIMVTREGGNVSDLITDKPRIDFHVLANSRTAAHNMAQVAQAVIFRSIGTKFPSFGIQITDVKVETGIVRVPDKETGSPRYIFSLRLTCVPT